MNGGLSKIRLVHTYVLKGFILVVSTVQFHCLLDNHLRHCKSLKNAWKSTNRHCQMKISIFSSSYEYLKTHYASINWPIWVKKVPKEAWRCWLQSSTIHSFTGAVGCQIIVEDVYNFILEQKNFKDLFKGLHFWWINTNLNDWIWPQWYDMDKKKYR